MVQFIKSDLDFILQQILIADAGGITGSNLVNVIPNVQLPWGLRTVDGSYNNLVFSEAAGIDQSQFGAADTVFPRMLTPTFRVADPVAFDPDGPGGQAVGDATSYAQTAGSVFDAQPRIISNLIQTAGLGITAANFATSVHITNSLITIDVDNLHITTGTIVLAGVAASAITVDDFKLLS
jgi:hypothetical protein